MSGVGMSQADEIDRLQSELAVARADLREAYVEASFYLKQLMDANEAEVDLAQKARWEELRALTWR